MPGLLYGGGPASGSVPLEPEEPDDPLDPLEPDEPEEPDEPLDPEEPDEPLDPLEPELPLLPGVRSLTVGVPKRSVEVAPPHATTERMPAPRTAPTARAFIKPEHGESRLGCPTSRVHKGDSFVSPLRSSFVDRDGHDGKKTGAREKAKAR
jgi:hypothetical protein